MSNISKVLEDALGKDKASEVVGITMKYDKYVLRFKNHINRLLEPIGFEVVIGLAFVPKKVQEKQNGSTN